MHFQNQSFSDSEVLKALQKELATQGVLMQISRVQRMSRIPLSASGKPPLIQSRLPRLAFIRK